MVVASIATSDPLDVDGYEGARGFFLDREEAGRALARLLKDRSDLHDPVVLALPRGGVPVGYEVASALGAPLDILLVRKLGVPGQPELAMGAIASGGVQVTNRQVMDQIWASKEEIERVVAEETRELERRERAYRGDRPPTDVRGRTVILVDDGVATGSSMLAAIEAIRVREPESVIVAVPVAPAETCTRLGSEADGVVCALTPEPFYAISLFYSSFPQTSDEEVREILDRAEAELTEKDGRSPEAR
jgi:putative phosphoribosyl transferase